jgi:hypothetical protein
VKNIELMKSKLFTNKVTIPAFFIMMTIIAGISIYRSCTVQKQGVYTIAILSNVTGTRGGVSFSFEYSYLDKKYSNFTVSPDMKRSDEGKRFFIQVLPNDPERCWVTNIRVPDSITQAPYSGWKELPIPKE